MRQRPCPRPAALRCVPTASKQRREVCAQGRTAASAAKFWGPRSSKSPVRFSSRWPTPCSGPALLHRGAAAPLHLALGTAAGQSEGLSKPGAPAAGHPHLEAAPGSHRCGLAPGPPRLAGRMWTLSAKTLPGANPQRTQRRSASSCVAECPLYVRCAAAPKSCVSGETCGVLYPCVSPGHRQYPAKQGSLVPVPDRKRLVLSNHRNTQRQYE